MEERKDYYKILGIDKNADENTIKKAYRKLAKKYHPDTNAGNAQAAEKFKQITTSYDRIFLFYQNYNTRFSICQYLCTKNMADQPGIFFLQQNFPHFVNYPLSKANGLPASQTS